MELFLHPHTEAIGFLAAILTTAAFAPQVYQTWRTGGRDLSWPMLMMFGCGVVLWLVYGWILKSPPVIFCNATTILQLLVIGILKNRHTNATE